MKTGTGIAIKVITKARIGGYQGRGQNWGSNQSNFQGRNRDWNSQNPNWGGSQGNYRSSSGGQDWGYQGNFQDRNRDWSNQGISQGQSWGGRQGSNQSGQQGEYYGRGPQGYKRSDDRVKEDINDHLTWHGGVDATDITVTVKNGEVTLEGTVSDRYQKRMAEDVAEQVQGVNEVQNRLRVKNENTSGSTGSTSQSSGGSKRSSSSQQEEDKNRSMSNAVPNGKTAR
jgi:osmotically-inducible protein OsmY